MDETLFWADRIADDIINREKYTYLDKEYVLPNKPSIKTSSSLSGVLHIGRLTDIIRGEAVYQALTDRGIDAQFIYVAEDMDPLRKIPKGVPESYREYIGVPVTDIPDPWGCHKSYAEHHVVEFFDIFSDFVKDEPARYSMREEYKKGNFDWAIDEVIKRSNEVREIINSFKEHPLAEGWVPYQVICENCGKIMTTAIRSFEDGRVKYVCQDYKFKSETAMGCGYEGELVPKGSTGKMVWKSEWAAQWKRWDVVGEGAGKEYIVPNSAFFVNAKICEQVYDYPATTPIFYEHITIGGGGKMSASVGNVVYPKDWLKVAPAEALRLLFLKRITKTRDFKWDDVPMLLDELDKMERIYFDVEEGGDKKTTSHIKRLYEMSITKKTPSDYTEVIPYSIAAIVSQVSNNEKPRMESILERLGYAINERTLDRIPLAGNWARLYGETIDVCKDLPDCANSLSDEQKKALGGIVGLLDTAKDDKELGKGIFALSKDLGISPKEIFGAIYCVLLNKEKGPRAASFILSLDKEFVKDRFLLKR